MGSKISESVFKADAKGNQVNETARGKTEKTENRYGRKEEVLTRNYDAVSKNGDTLELSENGRKMAGKPGAENMAPSGKRIISDTEKKISEKVLAGCSEAKIKQLYRNKKITRQQYERVMKMKKKR